ncbi:MAG: hypothetical protein IIC53_14850 [Proteobacteria bacterium]|nr:hypothetical protein [Pseudomonadota bacterium]
MILYGDSFAATTKQARSFEDILNEDPEFAKEHYLLNYGVSGYGVGQIHLLFENSFQHHENAIVVYSLMVHDLDRTILSVRTGQKPRLWIEGGQLRRPSEPMDPDPDHFYATHTPAIWSYLYRRFIHCRLMPSSATAWLSDEHAHTEEKRRLNGLILKDAIRQLRERGNEFVFLVFHTQWPGYATLDEDGWRDRFLLEFFKENAVRYIWSKDLLTPDMGGKATCGELGKAIAGAI